MKGLLALISLMCLLSESMKQEKSNVAVNVKTERTVVLRSKLEDLDICLRQCTAPSLIQLEVKRIVMIYLILVLLEI